MSAVCRVCGMEEEEVSGNQEKSSVTFGTLTL